MTTLRNEKGIALITALMITLLLSLVIIALAYRVGLFSVGTREHVIKSQGIYTAEIGLNQARYFMMANDCLPPNWDSCIPGINSTTFTNISSHLKTVFPSAMPEITVAGETFNLDLTGSMTRNGNDTYGYKVYVKQTNIPKVINIMAVSERPNDESARTVIDAGLIYTKPLGSDYKQLGQGGTREGLSGETLGTGADATTVSSTF